MTTSVFSTSSALVLFASTLLHTSLAQSDANGNDVFALGDTGGSKTTDSDSDGDDGSSNDRDSDHSTYYILIILLFFLLVLAVAYVMLVRRRRQKAYARRARIVSDMEAQRGQRTLIHERQSGGNVLSTWSIPMTPWRGRDWRGRRHAEELDEHGEAPPPYTPSGAGAGEADGDKIPGYEEVLERDRQRPADELVQRPELARTRLSTRGEDNDVAAASTASR